MMPERRRSMRQKSFLRGCVYSRNRMNSASCMIRNISPQGARLVLSAALNIPDVVELEIPDKMRTIHARVRWRHGDELGVAFGDANLAAGELLQISALEQRIAKLETEVALLRRLYDEGNSKLLVFNH
jgi:PilZ domain